MKRALLTALSVALVAVTGCSSAASGKEDAPGLASPAKKELAQRIVASAENSTLDWRSAYGYIEDIGDGHGYTAGIIGFCSGTHDMLALVEAYTGGAPGNGLARYLPALREVDGTDSHEGLDPGFTAAWAEAKPPAFRQAQDAERDRVYFDPAVRRAKLDGLGTGPVRLLRRHRHARPRRRRRQLRRHPRGAR